MVASAELSSPKINQMSRITTNERTVVKGQQFCRIILLDGKDYEMQIHKSARGKELFEKLAESLDLVEKDYFGLSYRDSEDKRNWLNSEKRIAKQLKNCPWVFWFEVKYYPPEPSQLQEDLTRYYLCLQVRNDVVSGKLPCSFMTYASLGSLLMQAQLGDYDPEQHGDPDSYLSDYSFAPASHQTHELLQKICDLHKSHKGQTPSEVELAYLDNAKKLAMYGVDLHQARDSEGADILLGVCSAGLLVYRDKLRINRFAWPKILKISYSRNNFYIKLRPGEFEQRETRVGFSLSNYKAAERLWIACVEHHTFFRLMAPEQTPKKSLLRFGSSKYRYSGRTQYQTRLASGLIERPQPQVPRSLSAGPLGSRSLDALSQQSVKKTDRPMSTMLPAQKSGPVRGKSVDRFDSDLEEQLARVPSPPSRDPDIRRSMDERYGIVNKNGKQRQSPVSDKNAQMYAPLGVVVGGSGEPYGPVTASKSPPISPSDGNYVFGEVTPPGKSRKQMDQERKKRELEEQRRKAALEKERGSNKDLSARKRQPPDTLGGVIVLEGTPMQSAGSPGSGKNIRYSPVHVPSSRYSPSDGRVQMKTAPIGLRHTPSPTGGVVAATRQQVSPPGGGRYSTSTPYKQVAPNTLLLDESGLVDHGDYAKFKQPSPSRNSPRLFQTDPYISTIVESEERSERLPIHVLSSVSPDGSSVQKVTKSGELKTVKKTLHKQAVQNYAIPVSSESELDEYNSRQSSLEFARRMKPTGVPPSSDRSVNNNSPSRQHNLHKSHSPPADPSGAGSPYIVSTQTRTNGNRIVEIVKYTTEKDGQVETHVDHRVTIHSAGGTIDHDAELTAAINEATKMNPNMIVEKVEVRRTSHQTEL